MIRDNLRNRAFEQQKSQILLNNQSGEDIPPYAVCKKKPDVAPYINENGVWIYEVEKPDADCENAQDPLGVVFNGHRWIKDSRRGWGSRVGPCEALLDSSTERRWFGPKAGEWHLFANGLTHFVSFVEERGEKYYGLVEPGSNTKAHIEFIDPISIGASGLVKILARTGSGGALEDTTLRLTVFNDSLRSINSGKGQAGLAQSEWTVDVHYCA